MSGQSERARTAVEVGFSFVVSTAAAAIFYRLRFIPFINANLHAIVAAVFLILPQLMLRGRGDIDRYGFTTHPRALGLTISAVGIFGVLPLYTGGFVVYQRLLCAYLPRLVDGSCVRILHPVWRLPPDFALLAAAQLIVVALPEELFFRGYLQGRLEDAWPPTWRLFGTRVGGAWLATAVLFGLGHFLVTFEPQMLTRFFPGLVFGWMYSRTRSILAGTLFHASCNLLMEVLRVSFFV